MVLLLIALLASHFLADFVLTLPVMVKAKTDGDKLWPIALHALVHGILVAVCLLIFSAGWLLIVVLALFEFLSHFAIDIAKARVTSRHERWADTSRRPYWLLFGFDQLLHQLVIVAIYFITINQSIH